MDGVLNISDYKPNYIQRNEDVPCPYCGCWLHTRTNRYLFRCRDAECGRYW
jgi:ribosomal protein L37AE/L43A